MDNRGLSPFTSARFSDFLLFCRSVRMPFRLCFAAIFSFVIFSLSISLAQATTVVTLTSSGSWTAPAGVTSVTVEVWGGGGAGGGQDQGSDGGGGGGGGGYSKKNTVTVIPGNSYTVSVGAGGAGVTSGTGGSGGDSYFVDATTVIAKGGVGGAPSTGTPPAGGAGGVAASGVGDVKYSGGNGGRGLDNKNGRGGPGGSSAGTAASGTSGPDPYSTQTAAAAPTGGGIGGDGGGGDKDGSAPASGNGGGGGGSGEGNSKKGGAGAGGKVVITYVGTPIVSSINRASFDPTSAGKTVLWTVTFTGSVTGVDASDFVLVQTGGAAGATISLVSGSGTVWTVTANTGTGSSGSLRLNLVDDNSIVDGAFPLGGAATGDGNFTGQAYTLLSSACTGAADIIFCDDFERSNAGAVGNSWTVTPASVSNCTGGAGNTGCAGIDSDIPPFNTYSNPRANPTRSMFTRWDIVSVDSPTVSLAGKTGAQLSFWMRRGGDAFSEYPEAAGENYLVEYWASDSSWKILAQYPSGVTEGQVFMPVIQLPEDALHAAFKMRFYQPSGSGKSGSGGAPGVVGYDYWHMDDVVIRETTGPSYVGAFCDNFEAGLGRWSISAEGASAAATIGDASIGSLAYQSASHELDMRWGYVTASTFKTDLVGVSGNITYWVRSGTNATRDPVTNENLVVEYQNSSGNWITLATYLGSAAASTIYSGSHAIPADAKHANFRLRFRKVAGSGYNKSYWHVDDVCVGDLLPTADLALSKTGGTLVPGTNTTYTLKATNNGPAALSGSMQIVDSLPSGLSYLGGSGTGWGCGANGQIVTCDWTGTLASGSLAPDLVLTVAVDAGVSGSVTNTATVTGTVNDNVAGNNTASYTSGNFVPAYVFTDKACATGVPIGTGATPCYLVVWSPQTAGTAKTGVFITAINGSGVPTQLSSSSATTVGFQFGLTCHDPVANAGVQATFSAASSPTLPLCAGNGAEPTSWSASTSLSFVAGSPSVATAYAFNYADVGEVELYIRNAAATTQKGTSGKFVVKPAGFALAEIKPTANPTGRCAVATTPAPTVTCASAAVDDAIFVRAGEAFSATVTALTSAGVAAPNFGKEKVPESVRLNPTNVVAGMVSAPDVAGVFAAFSSGVATGADFAWDEVGIITLTPKIKDGDYLGAGDVTGTISGNVGRFYPDHFDTVVTQGCATFTYSGQPFVVQVTARNLSGGKTSNYNGTTHFARLTTLSDAGVTTYLTDNTILDAGFIAGDGSGTVKYTFAIKETLPKVVTVRAQDTDGVVSGVTEGVAPVRSGRVRLVNANGSELLNLPLDLRLQYWEGATLGWQNNAADTCTAIQSSDFAFAFPGAGNSLASCETAITLAGTAPTYTASLTKPGAGNNGWADITLNLGATSAGNRCTAVAVGVGAAATTANVPWLQFNWTGAVGNPSARATFGVYRSGPIIHRREMY